MDSTNTMVLVGELNPYGADPYFALYHLPRNASGNRLREILGLRDHVYEQLDKVNLCTGKWSLPAARKAAHDLLERYRLVVCLGTKVRTAVGGPEFFTARAVTDGATAQTIVSLPHPSGLNRMWDEPGARETARRLMRDVAPWVEWGAEP